MRLLVGLGNPGAKYERTRHNIGFRVAEEAARTLGVALDSKRWNSHYGTGRAGGEQIAILLPQTFMNVSGEAVGPAARFWKVEAADLIVVHDEMELEFGRIQVKAGGGHGGHNGIKSLWQHVGKDFIRIRFGVGRPPPQWDPADYVLGNFSGAEDAQLPDLLQTATEAAVSCLEHGSVKAMNEFNRRKK